MATGNMTPSQNYQVANPNGLPCFCEMVTPGVARIFVGPADPGSTNGTYHQIAYPAGFFSYAGTEKVWIRNDADSGFIKLVVTEVS